MIPGKVQQLILLWSFTIILVLLLVLRVFLMRSKIREDLYLMDSTVEKRMKILNYLTTPLQAKLHERYLHSKLQYDTLTSAENEFELSPLTGSTNGRRGTCLVS